MRRKAFTLIELLVVIAIIAILAAILFPVFATAREKARATNCASNEKQILSAMIQYSQDFDEVYPSGAVNPSLGPGQLATWQGQIIPFLGIKSGGTTGGWATMPSVFVCPDNQVKFTASGNQFGAEVTYAMPDNDLGGKNAGWFGGPCSSCQSSATTGTCVLGGGMYGYYSGPGGSGILTAYDAGHIPKPSSTLMLVESPAPNNGFLAWNVGVDGPFYNFSSLVSTGAGCTPGTQSNAGEWVQDQYMPSYTPYHNGGWNYGFVDGHVKWMKPEQTLGQPGSSAPAYCWYGQPVPQGMWSVSHDN